MSDRPHDDSREGQQPASETSGPLGIGWIIFIILAVLTFVEFIVAVTIDANLPYMIVIAIMKAVLIIYYFMHVAKLWRGEGH